MKKVEKNLLRNELVRQDKILFGTKLDDLICEINAIYQDESLLAETMTTNLYGQT